MFKFGKLKWLLLFFLIVLFNCIQDAEIHENNDNPEVVLNCILNPDKDSVIIHLTYSKPIQSTTQFEAIRRSTSILLFDENENIGDFVWTDSCTYVLPHSVKPGIKYRIEANVKEKTIWAETTIPKTVDATIENADPEYYSYSYLISLKDDREDDNYYWISATGYEGVEEDRKKNIACLLYSNFEYADGFNQYIYQNGAYKFEYEYYIRFTNIELPDGKAEVIFYPQCISYPKEVFLLSVDYHLDKYMKSSLLMSNINYYAEEAPIAYSPFPVYSNINGGTGIFGSLNSVSKVFTKN